MATSVAMLLVATVVALMAVPGSAQQQIPSCASKLIPCGSYLNSTNPPETCCGPMKEAVKNELPCLCSLFKSPDLLKAFNIDLNQVLRLPSACGIKADTTLCSKSSGSAAAQSSSSSIATPSTTATPALPKGNSNSAHGAAWIGMSGLVSLFIILWAVGA